MTDTIRHRASWPHGAGRLTSTVYESGRVRFTVTRPKPARVSRPTIPERAPDEIRRRLVADIRRRSDRAAAMIGAGNGAGFRIEATDGHAAVMVPGDGDGRLASPGNPEQFQRETPGELWLRGDYGERFLEAATCSDGRVIHDPCPNSDLLYLLAGDDTSSAECLVDARFTLGAPELWAPFALNLGLVSPMLGAPELVLGFAGPREPVRLSVPGADWFLVVAPVAGMRPMPDHAGFDDACERAARRERARVWGAAA